MLAAMSEPESTVERETLERYVRQAANEALTYGSLCVAIVGLVGAAGLFGFSLLSGRREILGPCVAAALTALYALAVWAAARARRVHGRASYVVMLLLTSVPTFAILGTTAIYPQGGATLVAGPASYMYLFLITITGFLFSPRLTLICTASAAAQYFALQLWARPVLLRVQTPDPMLYLMLTSSFVYVFKTLTLVGTGIATAGTAWQCRRLVRRVLQEERERERIGRLFGEYVSPEVKQRVIEQKGRLIGERREVTVLFSDLRDFSSFSEGRDPAEVMDRLNVYFERMVRAIESEGGVVDKFVGDAVMAVFGGLIELENPCRAAVRAARAMRAALAALNAEWASRSLESFENGVGIHHGPVIQGPLGAENRKEFTVIGDAVNTASRLETCSKELGFSVVVSQEVFARLPAEERSSFAPVGELTLKGKREVLTAWGARL